MKTEVLTVRFNIVDRAASDPIWDAAKNDSPIMGMVPRALAWGDLFKERDQYEARWDALVDYLEDGAGLNTFDDLLDKVDEIERKYPIRNEDAES